MAASETIRYAGLKLTIEGGVEFQESLGEINRKLKQSEAELSKVTEAYAKNKKNAETLTAPKNHLEDSIRLNADQQKRLNEILDQAKTKYGENSKEVETLQTKLTNTEAKGVGLKRQLDEVTESLKKQEEAIKVMSWTKLSEDFKKAGEKFKKMGKEIADAGKKLTLTVTAPIMGGITASSNAAIGFESAFAGVRKTVDASEEEFATLEQGIRDMAKTLPTSAEDIAKVAEVAGQLDIEKKHILEFSRTMIDLGESTDLTAEQAATSFARFANITKMPQSEFDRLGSVVVGLGNNFATTEGEIMNMAMRLAGAGSQIGLSDAEIMGLATALSSVGIEAEMGGSAISRAMVKMESATATNEKFNQALEDLGTVSGISVPTTVREFQLLADNSDWFTAAADGLGMTKKELGNLLNSAVELENFAKISGMTGDEFKETFEGKAIDALQAFILGLGNTEEAGDSAIVMLQEMGLTEVRLRDSLLRTAGASDVLVDAVNLGTEAWEENAVTNSYNIFD